MKILFSLFYDKPVCSKISLSFAILFLLSFQFLNAQINNCDLLNVLDCTPIDCNNSPVPSECNGSDEECFRITFPFYFNYQPGGETSFSVTRLLLVGQVVGDGIIDIESSGIVYPLSGPVANESVFEATTSNFYWVVGCNNNNTYDIPLSENCQEPFLEITVLAEPGADIDVVIQQVEARFWSPIQTCENVDPCYFPGDTGIETKDPAPACASNLEIGMTLPTSPIQAPHSEEETVTIWVKNTGATGIALQEIDFRIDIEDIYENLHVTGWTPYLDGEVTDLNV